MRSMFTRQGIERWCGALGGAAIAVAIVGVLDARQATFGSRAVKFESRVPGVHVEMDAVAAAGANHRERHSSVTPMRKPVG